MRSKVLLSGVATFLALAGCGNGGTAKSPNTGGVPSTGGQPSGGTGSGGAETGGTTGSGGTKASGGTTGAGGSSSVGGITGSGGKTGTGGTTTTSSAGGTTGSGGSTGAGGSTSSGGQTGADAGTGTPTGGAKATGGSGAGKGGATGTSTGGVQGAGGSTSGSGGSSGIDGGVVAIDGGVNCSATMPDGGNTYTGSNVNGTADGLNYGIWSNGSGGSITVFPNVRAFAAAWNNSQDFLAHVGLDFNGSKSYTAYGTITAQFVESKTGSSGGWSSIGIYGWMHSPCVEWYINEDSFNGLYAPRNATQVTIGGDTYYVTTSTTTGTGGANACEAGHSGSWTNMTSTRKTARQCGTVVVSDHFAAWAAQGWSLGNLASVHVNVEVGGGQGSIQFPVADVTTTSK